MHEHTPEEVDKFIQQALADIDETSDDKENSRYLAAVQDVESGNYILVMMVPESALSDGVGPDLHTTGDKHKFLAAISENVFFNKAQEIEEEYPDANAEDKNELMAEFIATFMPGLFERANSMKPLDF